MLNAPTLQRDRHARGCPQCGQVLSVLDKTFAGRVKKDARFTCTNPKCDRFMRFTRPKPLGRRVDYPPLIRRL